MARGIVRPSELSREYVIQIRYRVRKSPEITVVRPKLQDRGDGKPLPHIYPGPKLCVYHPRYEDWTGADLIGQTIIPWVSEWLHFYELWLATGEWLGGGEQPRRKKGVPRRQGMP